MMGRHLAEPTPETRYAEEMARLDDDPVVSGLSYARHRYFPRTAIQCRLCCDKSRGA